MGAIVSFNGEGARSRARPERAVAQSSAEIIIFPGVRYERAPCGQGKRQRLQSHERDHLALLD